MMAILVNGELLEDSAHALNAMDRGLQYGDGVFETMRLLDGKVRYWLDHYARLRSGCERLQFLPPARAAIETDLDKLASQSAQGVVKLIVTRGVGGRGYRPARTIVPSRIVSLHPLPDSSENIQVRWCKTRWSRNAQLAGIKHLNRLEQVLAQNEWHDETIAEGLMLDTEGEVISATAANVFLVSGRTLITPDLRFSGVRGVFRQHVLSAATAIGLTIEERPVWPHDVDAAEEIFLTNAVRGLRIVTQLDERRWLPGPVTQQIEQWAAEHA